MLGGRRSTRMFQKVPGKPPGNRQEDTRRRPGGLGRPLGAPWEALRLKIPPRSPRKPPGNHQEGVKKFPRCRQEASGCRFWPTFCALRFSIIFRCLLKTSQEAPRRPKTAQDGHRRAQEGPQERILLDFRGQNPSKLAPGTHP